MPFATRGRLIYNGNRDATWFVVVTLLDPCGRIEVNKEKPRRVAGLSVGVSGEHQVDVPGYFVFASPFLELVRPEILQRIEQTYSLVALS